jgi:crotonyl-CoA carboxylase/reductase
VPDYLQKTVVREIMHRGVITCTPDTPLREVARIMNATDVHALFVVDERDVVLGVVSHRDIMTAEVRSISPEAPVPEAVQMMLDQRVHRLLVARQEGGAIVPVGIVSTTDVIDALWGRPWLWERPTARREEE